MSLIKVVIIGAGPAGVRCARGLYGDKRFAVTLINPTPELRCSPSWLPLGSQHESLELRVALSEVFANPRNVKIVVDRVRAIDTSAQTVESGSTTFAYDELVVATGLSYGSTEEYSTIVNSDAIKGGMTAPEIGNRHITVIGGGPVGITVVAEIAQCMDLNDAKNGHVELVESTPRILAKWPEVFARRVEQRLVQLGVTVRTSTSTRDGAGKTPRTLDTHERSIINIDVHNHRPLHSGLTFTEHGRLPVDSLRVQSHVWAAGDIAETSHTGWTSTAVYDGGYIADALKRLQAHEPMRVYSPPMPTPMIPVGAKWCATIYRGRYMYGYSGWILRRIKDYQLYRQLMPSRLALRRWLYPGTKTS